MRRWSAPGLQKAFSIADSFKGIHFNVGGPLASIGVSEHEILVTIRSGRLRLKFKVLGVLTDNRFDSYWRCLVV